MSFAIFWVLKLLAFNKLFHHQVELEEFDEHLTHEEEEESAHEGESAHSNPVRERRPATLRVVRAQSRKFSNCKGIPKSSALHLAMTSWRSSRFLPVTRS